MKNTKKTPCQKNCKTLLASSIIFLMVVGFLAIVTNTASGATYYCDLTLSTNGDGTSGNPWQLSQAMSGSVGPAAGDVVNLRGATAVLITWTGSNAKGSAGSHITYQQWAGQTQAQFEVARFIGTAIDLYLTFDGVWFKNDSLLSNTVSIDAGNLTFNNCEINGYSKVLDGDYSPYFGFYGAKSNNTTSLMAVGTSSDGYANITFTGCTIQYGTEVLSIQGITGFTFTGNTVKNWGDNGLTFTGSASSNIIVSNNTFYGGSCHKMGIYGTAIYEPNSTAWESYYGQTITQQVTGATAIYYGQRADGSAVIVENDSDHLYTNVPEGTGNNIFVLDSDHTKTFHFTSNPDNAHTDAINLVGGVSNTIISNNIVYQTAIASGQAIKINHPSITTTDFKNNLIYGWNHGSHGALISGCNDVDFYNNTILCGTSGVNALYINSDTAVGLDFENNIFEGDLVVSSAGSIHSANHNITNKSVWPTYWGAEAQGIKSADFSTGYFTNYSKDDYTLAVGSPAINMGDANYAPTTDILGNPRVGAPDAGCYEYIPLSFLPIGNKEINEGSTLTFTIDINDPNIETFIEVHNLPSEPNFINNIFSWTPGYNDAGIYEATFVAQNDLFEDSEVITITINNVNRSPVLAAISDNSVNENSLLSFTISATDADGDSITYSATGLPSGAALAGQTFSWTPGYDQAGTYQVIFTATDGQAEDSQTVNLTVNNTNHEPVLAAISDNSVNEGSLLSFTISATDADGDAITYSATGLSNGAAFAGQTFSWTPDYDQAGTYQVIFTATDGQAETSQTVNLTVNNINQSPVLATIGDKSVYEGDTLSFTISATDADGDSITYSAAGLPSGAAFASQTFSWTPDYNQAGTYQVIFTATDGQAETSQTVNLTVNNVNRSPVLAVISDNSVNENSLLSFTISATDADGDAITYSATGLPSGAALAGQTFSWTPSYDQAGTYQITFTATDGQTESSQTVNLTVNNVNRTPVLAAISDNSVNEGSLLSFTISATDADGDAITYSATGLPSGAAFTGQTFSWTPGYDQAGTYQVTFTATDDQAEDSQTVNLTVNNVNRAPLLTAISDKSVKVDNLSSFTINATDADSDVITYSATGLPSGATFAGQTFSWTPNSDQTGVYQVIFTATDGQTESSQTVNLTVNVNRAPVLAAISDNSVNEGSLLSFTISATDADGDAITYSATGLPSGAAFAGQTFSWTPDYDQAGTYQVTFTATDGEAQDSQTVNLTVSNVNRAPVFAAISDNSVNENSLLSFTISATDADSDAITYSATGLPNGATFAGQTFSWTPGYDQAGTYQVIFTATDGQAQNSQTVNLTVNNVNRTPVLAAISDNSVNEGSLLSFTISATDADSDAITYSATGLPSGAALAGQTFSWTPDYDQAGTYQVIFTATDGQAETSQTVNLTVNNINQSPVLATIGDKSVYEGDTLSFTISATDADGDSITYSAAGLPSGAAFASQTFSWTPDYNQAGTYQVIFTATDGQAETSQTVNLTVNNTVYVNSNKATTEDSSLLLNETFDNGTFARWSIIDEGTIAGPSSWSASTGTMVQNSNIYTNYWPSQPGTYALYKTGTIWTNYKVSLTMKSTDNKSLGVMFRYKDKNNYYRFSWDNNRRLRQVIRKYNGKFTLLCIGSASYEVGRNYQIDIVANGTRLQVFIDNVLVLQTFDNRLSSGSIALYSWANAGSCFDDIVVQKF